MKTRRKNVQIYFSYQQQQKLHYICQMYVLLYYLMHKTMKYKRTEQKNISINKWQQTTCRNVEID